MKLGLRIRLIGTLVGAMLLFFVVSVLAANQTMTSDLNNLARTDVSNGALGFGGYWDEKRDQVRVLTQQVAIQDAIRRDVAAKNSSALGAALTNIASSTGLSFLTITDLHGHVIARANGGQSGMELSSPFVARALSGETVNTAATLDIGELEAAGLGPQATADVRSADGNTTYKLQHGLALIAAAPVNDANERTIGAIYGGVLLNHYYDNVDQATKTLGGQTAVLLNSAVVASSISRTDGTRLVDIDVANYAKVAGGHAFKGIDTEGGTPYLVEIDPILDDGEHVVGARWYGVPLAQFTDIQNHTIISIVLWGVVGLLVALAITIPVVESLCRALIGRSRQIRSSAKELSVIVVGSEVSGDHVAQTKETVEKQGALLAELPQNDAAVATAALLNAEILGDIIVIDTLASEMSARMQQAVERVGELNDVAEGLNKLVTGR
jgi:hypothetical protein